MNKLPKAELLVVGFTLGYMVIWLTASLILNNDECLYYLLIMCVLMVGVAVVHLRVRFHIAALWGCRSGDWSTWQAA